MGRDKDIVVNGEELSIYGKSLLKALGKRDGRLELNPACARFWGVEHPKSLFNLIEDPELIEAASKIPLELFSVPEAELETTCPDGRPSRQDRRLRIEFWEAYEASAARLETMDLDAVVQGTGIIHWSAYRPMLLEDASFLAWFLTPPASYRVQMKEAMELGLARIIEILSLPMCPRDADGKPVGKVNVGIGALILQAYKLIDLRNNGAVAQKIVNLNATAGAIPEDGTMTPEEIDRKLAELEAKIQGRPVQLPPPPAEVKDVISEALMEDPRGRKKTGP